MANPVVISVEQLSKEYRPGLFKKHVRAIESVTFQVEQGEIFGFVGPNGAGKTTTIRALMGLIRPTRGRCVILGDEVPSRKARTRLGFLPEAPYFYDYLSAREYLHLAGQLFGLDAATRQKRAGELLERVGLAKAADKPMRKYSKGMLQRAGLAQALINDPELVVLDEPMSGLDPIGRKEVRDLIESLADAGKTVFFSTHILPDVEAICDRVAIISQGKVLDTGPVERLLDAHVLGTDAILEVDEGRDLGSLVPQGARTRRVGRQLSVELPGDVAVTPWLRALPEDIKVLQVQPRKESLEDLYVRVTSAGGAP
jgi:ABC-2 type transport system ATP-binding protein